MGPAAGGAVYSPAMTDFVFMVKKTSYMFITGPAVIKSVTSEEIGNEELGGALTHSTKSGVTQFACDSDQQAIEEIKKLLGYLPLNNEQKAPYMASADSPDRAEAALDDILPENANKTYNMKEVIRAIVDNGEFLGSTRRI
jgi:acetyl-CoA carboxylase carboxyltransferase component